MLQRLTMDPRVIAISCNVTYWDRLRWRDTLGQAANTELQRRYAARGIANGQIYTPQAAINGAVGVIGSRTQQIDSAIAAAALGRHVPIRITATGIETIKAAPVHEPRLIAIARARRVNVGTGENGNRRHSYQTR